MYERYVNVRPWYNCGSIFDELRSKKQSAIALEKVLVVGYKLMTLRGSGTVTA